jgi:hypothetical protein
MNMPTPTVYARKLREEAEYGKEIGILRSKLEHVYRVLDYGFKFGVFDFSILKKETDKYLAEIDSPSEAIEAIRDDLREIMK